MVTYSLTFGDCGENHVGMEMIGEKGVDGDGLNIDDLNNIKKYFEKENKNCELYYLNELYRDEELEYKGEIEDGYLLVVRNFLGDERMRKMMESFEWDSKYWDRRRGKVLNKRARFNVCFDFESRDSDFENGRGSIIGYDRVIELKNAREELMNIIGKKGEDLICEGNKYYDISKCGIGFHGDSERKKVICVRLGDSMKLCYSWFYRSKNVGKKLVLDINGGDLYFMSEKSVGNDWKRRSIMSLRHSAGCDKYIKLKKELEEDKKVRKEEREKERRKKKLNKLFK